MQSEHELNLSELKFDENKVIETDEGRPINCVKPDVLRIPTDLPDLEGLKKCSDNDIFDYLNDMIDDGHRIKNINGEEDFLYCGHCPGDIFNPWGCNGGSPLYFYCYDCHKLMCLTCYGETSEEIALKNGAKNWAKRKDSLEACRGHDLQKRIIKGITRVCDSCDEKCNEDPVYYTNVKDDLDACIKCVEEGKIDIVKLNLEKVEKRDPVNQRELEKMDHFGSFLDWVPLFMDTDVQDYILYCANPESILFKRCALACGDNHGRMGFFTCTEKDTIDVLVDEYKETQKKCNDRMKRYEEKKKVDNKNVEEDGNESDDSADSDNCSGWGKHYNSPVKTMMQKRNMSTHFG